MIWFLERGDDVMVCEARRDGPRFELAIGSHDGSERVEYIEDPSLLVQRLTECQRELRRSGWRILTRDGHIRITAVED